MTSIRDPPLKWSQSDLRFKAIKKKDNKGKKKIRSGLAKKATKLQKLATNEK